MQAVICPVCNGKGKIEDEDSTANKLKECHGCSGKGWVEVSDSIPYQPYYPPVSPYVPWYKETSPWYTW